MKAQNWQLLTGAIILSLAVIVQCQGGIIITSPANGGTVTPPTDDGSGSGSGERPTTRRECYGEGSINPSLLDYDYGILISVVGPIEICVDGQYESLCDIGWDELDAQALCRREIGSNSVAEPLYGLGFPRKRYASRTFNCSDSEYNYGLGSCRYTSDIHPECYNGPHVAGVRCVQRCREGEVRLRNSTSTYNYRLSTIRGRVDVCSNGTFLPICDVGWDNRDAQVVCNDNYGSDFLGEVYPSFHLFPSSSYLAQEFMCNGTEYSLSQCDYNRSISSECFVGNRSAAVVCRQLCREGDVRLVNQSYTSTTGLTATSGVVQVCVNREYGYVCADDWDDREAEVVCSSISSGYRAPYFENTASTTSLIPEDAPIYRYSMCNGTEYNFNRCQLSRSDSSSICPSIGTVNCTEVITRCYGEGNFRLINETTEYSFDGPYTQTVTGRIEVCANSSYKSLCYQYWDPVDAQVFCQDRLRYRGPLNSDITGRLVPPSQYGYSRAGVVAYDVSCNGSERRLEDCDLDKFPNSDILCQDPASSAAGVECILTETPIPCSPFDVRASNQTYRTTQGFYTTIEANIEVCIDGAYVAVCDLGWDDNDAQVACNALGYNEPFYRGVAVGGLTATAPIGIENAECPSNAVSALQCSGDIPPHSPRCFSNFSAAGVHCIQERTQCYGEGDFSIVNITYDNYLALLIGGGYSVSARVGVCQGGAYGSVCDANWGPEEANATCNSLNLGSDFDAIPLYGYDAGLDPIVLETVNCTGNESNPAFCPTSPLGQITNPVCRESNRAAGVRCSSKPGSCFQGATRLVDGPTFYEGRLEICRNNTWLAVCERDFNTTTASNVCNGNLFLAGSNVEVISGSAYGPGEGTVLVACQADFYSFYFPEFVPIGSCSSSTATNLTCNHENDVGLRCSKGQVDILALPRGSRRLGSSSFYLQCFAQQLPWNTTLISGGWYDSDGNPVTETSNGGSISVDLLQNIYDSGGSGVNLTYTFRNQLNFNHPLSVSDGGYYLCNVSVELTYPDKSTAKLSNVTLYPLVIEVPPPQAVMITSEDTPYQNRPYTATCLVTFEAAVPLDNVEIEWTTADGRELTYISDRVSLSEIRKINDSTFARDVIVSPLSLQDNGTTYVCEAGVEGEFISSHSVYKSANITVLSPPPSPPEIKGLCSNVVWYSPAVSCEGISGYEVMLYSPQSLHKNLTRRVGANGTFYIIEDEDKLAMVGSEDTHVQVRVIHSSGIGDWSVGTPLGCDSKPTPTPTPETPRVYFEINGKVYLNNSVLPLTDVGEGTSALYCKTDKEECCGTVPNRFGEYYYPSGVQVPIGNRQQGFYRNRGNQIIRLNRREGTTSPTGTYRCEIPNADDETVKIYITLTE